MSRLLLSKAGAGSRGGRVIGSTKSGKPIYESKHARYASLHVHDKGDIGKDASHVDGSFTHYSKQDHEEAASAHFKQAYEADHVKGVPTVKGQEHMRAALAHNRLANTSSRKSLTSDDIMTSADLYKSFLAKSTFTSGNIQNAETVDLDADMTGESSKGKSTSAPSGDDDRDAEVKKVKKKVDKNTKNGGDTKSVAEIVGFSDSDAGKETKLQNVGPYDIGGDVDDDIGVPPSGQLIDGYILRSEQLGDLLKGGAGSRGGQVIGHTKSGKAVYANRGAGSSKYARFSGQDHEDAQGIHQAAIQHLHKKMSKVSEAGGENTSADKAQYLAHHNAIGMHNHKAVQKYHPMGFGFGESKTAKSEDCGGLVKSGEGSRGGKIIGHTKSGKAVYQHVHADTSKYSGFNAADHEDAMKLHSDASEKALRSFGNDGDKNADLHDKSKKHLKISQDHAFQMGLKTVRGDNSSSYKILKSEKHCSDYQGADAKAYQQRVEQRGFITHTSGGMDDYLANLSKGNSFYANGTDHHSPQDQNNVGQTLCKSCDQEHSSLYGVCPHCGPGAATNKSYSRSQDHRGAYMMQGQQQASGLVDMSRFSLRD